MTALTCWRGLLVLVAGGRVEHGAVERLVPHLARVVGVGEDLQGFVRVGRRQVQVVVDELPEGVAEVGQALAASTVLRSCAGFAGFAWLLRMSLMTRALGFCGSDGELMPLA